MSSLILQASFFLVTTSVAWADAKSEVSDAITKLGGESDYSWTATPKTEGSKSGSRQGPIEGKTEKSGLTRLKGSAGDTSYEVGFKGEKIVVNFNGDWLSAAELGENGSAIQRLKAFKKPVDEAAGLVKKTKDLKKESDGVYGGELAPDAAKGMFATLGRRAAEASEAQGSVKFWVKEGRLAKYEFIVKGRITVGEDKRDVEITRTTTVEIKDVGSTKVTFPDEAKKKLS